MTTLSTHVLDAGSGRPAVGVAIVLEHRGDDGGWVHLGEGHTDDDGRLATLAPDGLAPGTLRLTFATGDYFRATNQVGYYPEVSVVFEVTDAGGHHHVPLLLSPFAYSTYRGS